MKRFAALYRRLDRSTATLDRQAALTAYLAEAPPEDAAWALWLLSGNKIGGAGKRLAGHRELRTWVAEVTGLADWLVDACYAQVGDLAETIALLIDDPVAPDGEDLALSAWIEKRLLPVSNATEAERRAVVEAAWRSLRFDERLVFTKLLTGSLRIGVSAGMVQRALSAVSGVPLATIAQRMLGPWQPGPAFLERLLSADAHPGDVSAPYPFFLASPIEVDPASLGSADDWLIEWKWDGIRLQLIRRSGSVALWSRGEERLDGRFPEIEAAAADLPADAVLDGELVAWGEADTPLPFSALQTRIQRERPGPRSIAAAPVRMLAYDLLEQDGRDLRELPLRERRDKLASLLSIRADRRIALSPSVTADGWDAARAARESSRARSVEGLMLKRLDSTYQHGRRRGDWWKWKIDPLTIDAVLLYAQSGHGRRSTLYTDYTFGLWDGDRLVPVAKAYSGLSDIEILKLDAWIRANTIERFGPVRSVKAAHVFELGFEGVNRSPRHKSGIAVRFPRILRWRTDKPAPEADRLETLAAMAR